MKSIKAFDWIPVKKQIRNNVKNQQHFYNGIVKWNCEPRQETSYNQNKEFIPTNVNKTKPQFWIKNSSKNN